MNDPLSFVQTLLIQPFNRFTATAAGTSFIEKYTMDLALERLIMRVYLPHFCNPRRAILRHSLDCGSLVKSVEKKIMLGCYGPPMVLDFASRIDSCFSEWASLELPSLFTS